MLGVEGMRARIARQGRGAAWDALNGSSRSRSGALVSHALVATTGGAFILNSEP